MPPIVRMELGSVFGRLTVIAREKTASDGHAMYRCRCNCLRGNERIVTGVHLRQGHTQSCGCLRRDNKGPSTHEYNWRPAFNSTVNSYKTSARKRNLQWSLTHEQCLTLFRGACVYCGDLETNTFIKKRKDYEPSIFIYNGIDRVDSSQGYVIENVVSCCYIDNRAKLDMPVLEYQAWLKRLAAFQNRLS